MAGNRVVDTALGFAGDPAFVGAWELGGSGPKTGAGQAAVGLNGLSQGGLAGPAEGFPVGRMVLA